MAFAQPQNSGASGTEGTGSPPVNSPSSSATPGAPPSSPATARKGKPARVVEKDTDERNSNSEESVDDLFKSLDYPELQVVPRASERLALESDYEKSNWMFSMWPIEISSLATLYAAMQTKDTYHDTNPSEQQKSAAANANQLGLLVGGGTLAASLVIPFLRPYTSSLQKVRAIRGNEKRPALLRERLAEEALESQARVMGIVKNFSVVTNLLAGLSMAGSCSVQTEKYADAAILLSVLPLLFPPREIEVYEKHIEYKKRIYTPVSSFGWDLNQRTAKLEPRYILRWEF
jgi:hypothetical protein